MSENLKKGFTLIELLVVVAIIGVLSALVLAALNSARSKGGDAGVKSFLVNARAQAEVFYNTNTAAVDTYTNVCAVGPTVGGANTINPHVLGAARSVGLSTVSIDAAQNGSAPYLAICNDGTGVGWAAEVPLSSGTNQFWCVDSTGKSKQTTGTSISSTTDVTCQ